MRRQKCARLKRFVRLAKIIFRGTPSRRKQSGKLLRQIRNSSQTSHAEWLLAYYMHRASGKLAHGTNHNPRFGTTPARLESRSPFWRGKQGYRHPLTLAAGHPLFISAVLHAQRMVDARTDPGAVSLVS